MIGTRVGNIRILDLLAQGGMGRVYVGYDEALRRKVALKSLRGGRLSAAAQDRLLDEARILSRLEHPHICTIHGVVAGEDEHYLVLELIDGRTLEEAVGEGLDAATELRIARQVAEVLVAAHAAGVVHRDLKPANVMLTTAGEVKVLDFGISGRIEPAEAGPEETGAAGADPGSPEPPDATLAMPLRPGGGAGASGDGEIPAKRRVLGTLLYMSPEQARGEAATPSSDMYSFGLLLQTLLTGRPPYDLDDDSKPLVERVALAETLPLAHRRPTGGALDPDLVALVGRLLAPAPAARPTAVEAAARLEWIAAKPRRRRRRLVAAALVAVALAGGAKYTFDLDRERTAAVAAREEADRRRGQAEELINFMLGDLRGKLAPIGRLDVLDEVGDQALDYFAALPEEELTDEELYRRAQALTQLGEVRIAQGDLDAAEEAFRQALGQLEDLVDRRPDDLRYLAGLGTGHFWVGNALRLRGDLDATLTHLRQYQRIGQRLTALEPQNLDWTLEESYGHSNVGYVLQAQGDYERALEAYGRALELKERLVSADPTDAEARAAMAAGHNSLGWLEERLGRPQAALDHYRRELAIKRRLVDEAPEDSRRREQLAVAYNYLGSLYETQGDLEAAREAFTAEISLDEELVELEPTHTYWQRNLAISEGRLAGVERAAGNPREAMVLYRRALRRIGGLLARDPERPLWLRDRALLQVGIARALAATGDHAGALEAAGGASEQVSTAVEDPGSSPEVASLYAEALLVQGVARAALGRPEAAEEAWRRVVSLLEPLARAGRDYRLLAPLAKAHLHLNEPQSAGPVLAALDSLGYRELELVELRRRSGGVSTDDPKP